MKNILRSEEISKDNGNGQVSKNTEFLQLYPSYRHEEAILDSLWNVSVMTEHLRINIASVAVLVGD